MNRLEKYGPPVILNLLALLPLAWLAWDIALGHLSVNPIQDIQIRTGRTAIIMLVVSLAGTLEEAASLDDEGLQLLAMAPGLGQHEVGAARNVEEVGGEP